MVGLRQIVKVFGLLISQHNMYEVVSTAEIPMKEILIVHTFAKGGFVPFRNVLFVHKILRL